VADTVGDLRVPSDDELAHLTDVRRPRLNLEVTVAAGS
jgi:hypothetical protein